MKYDVLDVLWWYGCYMMLYDEVILCYGIHVLSSLMKKDYKIMNQKNFWPRKKLRGSKSSGMYFIKDLKTNLQESNLQKQEKQRCR